MPEATGGPRGGPATPQGAAGTQRAGEGRGPLRSVAPRSRSKQKAPVPRAAAAATAAAAAAALSTSPPRPGAHVTRAPSPPLSARLLGVVVLRGVRRYSPAAEAKADYTAQDASRPPFLGPLRFRRWPQSGPSGKEAGLESRQHGGRQWWRLWAAPGNSRALISPERREGL